MMRRRPRRTPAASAAWSAAAALLAADAAVVSMRALQNLTTASIVLAAAVDYLAVIVLCQALVYGCSVAWHAGRSYRRGDRPVLPPSQRAAYTPQQLVQHRDYAQADVLAYASRHAAPDVPVRDGLTQPLPDVTRAAWSGVVTGPAGLPWPAPVAGPAGGVR